MTCENGRHKGTGAYCTTCGAPNTATCVGCGAAVGNEDAFCGKCGRRQVNASETTDLWRRDEKRKRYTQTISSPCSLDSVTQCTAEEITGHDDLKPVRHCYGFFECCIIKPIPDPYERSKIASLKHTNLPTHIRFRESTAECKHSVLQVFVSSDTQSLLSYFLQHQPKLQDRITFYHQIVSAVSHLHDQNLIVGHLNPLHIMVVDKGRKNTERTEGKYVMRDVTKPVPDARLPAAMIRGMIVLWWAYGLCPYHVVFRANY